MVDRTWKVKVTAGAHTWTVTDLDPPVAGLMDPLTIGWSLPDNVARPAQPDVMVATFGVVAATAGDLDDLILGDLVAIEVTFGASDKTSPDVVFYGRIAQGQATPHTAGMLYRFTCADLTTDLGGWDIGNTPYLFSSVGGRTAAFMDTSGVGDTNLVRDPVVAAMSTSLMVPGLASPNAESLLTALIGLYDQVALPGLVELAPVNYRAIVAPHPGTGAPSGIPYKYALDAVSDAYVATAAAPLPATFGHYYPDPQGYGLAMDPDDRAAGVIDACVVDFASDWTAIQPHVVNRAAVTWLTTDATNPTDTLHPRVTYNTETPPPPGQPPTTVTRETQILGFSTPSDAVWIQAQANVTRLAAMMVPPPQNPAGWSPDAFRWLLYKDPAGLAAFPAVFPHHDATDQKTPRALRTACYVRPVAITGIPGKWNPPDATQDWVAGQLSKVTLTIADGRPVIDFELSPTLPDQANPTTTSNAWNTQVGTWDAQTGTWDDLEPGRPAFRWDDPALVGVTWDQLRPQPWNMYRLARGT